MSGADAGDAERRRATIVRLVGQRGFVTIEELASRFSVSAQTVRRDIRNLASRHLVTRYHGGAGLAALAAKGDRLDYATRKLHCATEKRMIAGCIADEIPDGASLFIDIGTTMEAVARALVQRSGLRVITNHLAVASILSDAQASEVLLPGGLLRNSDQAITGEAATAFIRGFRVGYGIFGIGAIDADGALLDHDYRDVQLSTAAMAISRRRFVALDHSKFGSGEAIVRVGHVSDIDAVFTDVAPPREIAEMLSNKGVRVVVASASEGETDGIMGEVADRAPVVR